MSRDRAVSDVFAFVLTFAVIILSLSAVSIVGVDQLTTASDSEQINSAEEGMVALAATLEDSTIQGDRKRATALTIGDGSIELAESGLWVDVQANSSGKDWNTATNGDRRVPVGAIEHRLEAGDRNSAISYEAGGVFRSDRASISFEPAFRCAPTHGTAVLTIVNMTGEFRVGAGSSGFEIGPEDVPTEAPVQDSEQTLRLSATMTNSTVRYVSLDRRVDKTVYLNVSGTANAEQWKRYLTDSGWTQQTVGGNDVFACQGDPLHSVVVRVVTLDIEGEL